MGPGRTVHALRLALGAGGLVVLGAGVASLVGAPLPALVSIVVFLALGVIAHDALIAPATIAGGAAARRVLPRAYLAPLVVAAVLLGTLTVVAVPVLVGINESPDNATVVDRPYRATWAVLLALTAVAVAVAGAVRSGLDAESAAPDPVPHHRSVPVGAPPVTVGAGGGRRGADVAPEGRRAPTALLALSTAAVIVAGAVRSVRRPPGRDRPRSP